MTSVALCKFAPRAPSRSGQLTRDHDDYLRNNSELISLYAHLIGGEDSSVSDQHRELSCYIVDGDEGQAKALVMGDPYFVAGTWDRVELYRCSGLLGAWSPGHAEQFARMRDLLPEPEMLPALPAAGVFAVISTLGDQPVGDERGLGHRRNSARLFRRLLVAAPLEHTESLGAPSSARPHRSIYLYQGADIDDVRAMVAGDPLTRDQIWQLRLFEVAELAGTISR